MAAMQPLFCPGRAAVACLGRSAAETNVRPMVKQGGSETAENDGSKLVNVVHTLFCGHCLVAVATLRGGAVIPTPSPVA
jgi:hypothetical protein